MLVMRAYFGVLISLSLMVAAMSLWEFRGQSSTFLFAHLSGHINEGSVYSQPTTETNDQIPSEERILTGIKAVGDPSGWCVGGLVGGYTCCPASCGACGGVDCANRPGGKACCTDVVLKLCQTPDDTSGCAVAHLAYAHYEAAGTLWRQEAAIHAATVDAAAAHSRANHTFPTHANVTHVTHEFEPDAANSAPFRRLLSDESVSSIGSKGSTSTINSVSTRSSTSSSTTIGGSSHTNHDDGCGALPDAGEALAARVQAATKGCSIVVFSTVNYPIGTRLPDPREMLDFGKRSTFIGFNNGSFLEDWRTCYVLVVGAASAVDLKQRHGSDLSPWILVLDHIDEDDEGERAEETNPKLVSNSNVRSRRRERRRLRENNGYASSSDNSNGRKSRQYVNSSATVDGSNTTASHNGTLHGNLNHAKVEDGEEVDGNSGRRASRLLKIMPHRFFPHAKAAVFVDWKLKLVQHPALLVWRTLTAHGGEVGFSAFRHPCTTSYTVNPLCSPRWATSARPKANLTASRLALLKARYSYQREDGDGDERRTVTRENRRGRGGQEGGMHEGVPHQDQERHHQHQHQHHHHYQQRQRGRYEHENHHQQDQRQPEHREQQSRRQLQSKFFGTRAAARKIMKDPWFNAWGNEEDFTYEDDLVDLPNLSREDEVRAEHLDARRWWHRELRLILRSNKTSNTEAVRAQEARYRREGLDLRHYAEGGLIVIAPQAKHARSLACRWWQEYSRRDSCDRDQPALAATLAYTLNPRGSKHVHHDGGGHSVRKHGHARAHPVGSKNKNKDAHSVLLDHHIGSSSSSPMVSFGPPSVVLFPHNYQLTLANESNSSSSSNNSSNSSNDADNEDDDDDEDEDDGVDGGTAGEGLGDGTGVLLLNEGPRGECGGLCHWYEGETVAMKRPKVALSRAQLLHNKAVKDARLAKKSALKLVSKVALKVQDKQAELAGAQRKATAAEAAGDANAATAAHKEAAKHTASLKILTAELSMVEARAAALTTNSPAAAAAAA